MEGEIWKDHPDYAGYQFSNMGRMKLLDGSISRGKPGSSVKNSYIRVSLGNSGKLKLLHRMIIETFLGKREGLIVNHINGDRYDNRLENLEWVTPKENSNRKVFPNTKPTGEAKVNQLSLNGEFIKEWPSVTNAAEVLGTSRQCIYGVCRGRYHTAANYKWEYVKIIIDGEEWKDIEYEGVKYTVSNFGRIRYKDGRESFGSKRGNGYLEVQPHRGKTVGIHRLICYAFKYRADYKDFYVDHIDNNGENNHIDNLEWVTPSENSKRALKFYDRSKAVIQMDIHRNFIQRFKSINMAAKSLGISEGLRKACKYNKIACGYLWKYEE